MEEEKERVAREGESEVEEAGQRGWFFCGRRQSSAMTARGVRGEGGENRKRTIVGNGIFMGRDLWERVARAR